MFKEMMTSKFVVQVLPDYIIRLILSQVDFFTANGLRVAFKEAGANEAQKKAIIITLYVNLEAFAEDFVEATETELDDLALEEVRDGLKELAEELGLILPEVGD